MRAFLVLNVCLKIGINVILMKVHFMNTGDAGITIPLIGSSFSPSCHPLLSWFSVFMGTAIFCSASYACLIAFMECTFT